MKKRTIIAALAAGMTLVAGMAPVHAATVDFANEADSNGERGLANGALLSLGGVNMQLFATASDDDDEDAFAYLDAGLAGLGVCKDVTAAAQCNPGNDDNVTENETVTIAFLDGDNQTSLARTVTDLQFRAADHSLLPSELSFGQQEGGQLLGELVRIITDNGALTDTFGAFIFMARSGDTFFADTTFIRFDFVNTQFYVSSLEVLDTPIPGAIPLLFSGLAGLGFASRGKRKTARA